MPSNDDQVLSSPSRNPLRIEPNSPVRTSPIVSLRRTHHDPDHSHASYEESVAHDLAPPNQTSTTQTFISLIKGYIGPGCLSLPWAVSQLGIVGGCVACCLVAYWSSYNCWTIVRLKRAMAQAQEEQDIIEATVDPSSEILEYPDNANGGGGNPTRVVDNHGASHQDHSASSLGEHPHHTHNSHITYPQVAGWYCGPRLQIIATAGIFVQQMSVCTVFLSFCGANLEAVLEAVYGFDLSHIAVITCILPIAASLSLLPSLKSLAPVMLVATALLFLGLSLIAVIVIISWSDRPHEPIEVNWWKSPLAFCAILYSYEGICLILPVESAMSKPQKFQSVFVQAMSVAAMTFCATAALCVLSFGQVTNGSITAFLLENHGDESRTKPLVLAANAAVSVSVLLTYPLQLFPCFELVANVPLTRLFIRRSTDFAAVQRDFEDNGHQDASSSSIQSHGSGGILNTQTQSEREWPMRIVLVLITYIIAAAIPNVESLISLAGALAGSSTALLIPPWLQISASSRNGGSESVVGSYALFAAGFVFLLIGTTSSVVDIVKVYLS